MKVLGIHDGHNASACLYEDGTILGLVSEERFTKVKNMGGFPYHSINWLLKSTQTEISKIDKIAFATMTQPLQDISYYQKGLRKYLAYLSHVIPDFCFRSQIISHFYKSLNFKKRQELKEYSEYFQQLDLSKEKVEFVEHHLAHASSAYYSDCNFSFGRKVLIFTLDGAGDGLSATVNIGENGKIRRIFSVPFFDSLGIFFSRTTMFLGMKPLEHEYKIMGMAPYCSEKYVEKSYKIFKKYIQLDGLNIKNTSGLWGNGLLKQFQKDFFMHRFDSVCGGIQKITEEIALGWILNWVRETNISDICLAGGVFMNVKLNMLINEHQEIHSAFFMPSCGDESTSLGAAMELYVKYTKNPKPQPLLDLYLGPKYEDAKIEKIIHQSGFKYEYREDINEKISNLLTEEKILGRVCGKMEFGARSLGNRSILCSPNKLENVKKINQAVKKRDFWMPFAPSILDIYGEKYLSSKKKLKAPFMILGFQTTYEGRNDLIACVHQSDSSCRPQILEKNSNPKYYQLIEHFLEKSKIGGLLNTSLNLHGYPMVNDPKEAIWTFENSDLDYLQIENFLIKK